MDNIGFISDYNYFKDNDKTNSDKENSLDTTCMKNPIQYILQKQNKNIFPMNMMNKMGNNNMMNQMQNQMMINNPLGKNNIMNQMGNNNMMNPMVLNPMESNNNMMNQMGNNNIMNNMMLNPMGNNSLKNSWTITI